ncbi:MAG: chorismate-binding protein, partial [Arenimonas sp.]
MIQQALPRDLSFIDLQRLAPERYPLLLESVADSKALSRWDFLFIANGEGLICDAAGQTSDLAGKKMPGEFLNVLDSDWKNSQIKDGDKDGDSDIPFRGGWTLFLSYELAGQIESRLKLPVSSNPLPMALALRCPAAVLRNKNTGEVFFIAEDGNEAMLSQLQKDIVDMESLAPLAALSKPNVIDEEAPGKFLSGVDNIHQYLRQGDTFQVNLSRAWRAEFAEPPEPASLYQSLCRHNPAPFAGSLIYKNWALLSSSPERLVSSHGGDVQTRPIAGTRPRFPGDDDQDRIRELVGHPKERAEHVMLIDLERNDLGRVCKPGSVHVDELMAVESYAHVHHIVSNVRGHLREDVTPGQVIAAVFPGGTITG